MLGLIERKANSGVRVRILGKVERKWPDGEIEGRAIRGIRLHVRAIVRDGRRAFVGSQSLRKTELDKRREVGVFIRERSIVRRLQTTFEHDWRYADRDGTKSARRNEHK
jgi:cardiolipin synthase A/B